MNYPDIHSFKALEEYFSLKERLLTVRNAEEERRICLKMIALSVPAFDEQKRYNDLHRQSAKETAALLGEEYREPREIRIVTAAPFKRLAIICEREGDFPQAVRICKRAIELNLTDDGTKAGMNGRLQRLLKKG